MKTRRRKPVAALLLCTVAVLCTVPLARGFSSSPAGVASCCRTKASCCCHGKDGAHAEQAAWKAAADCSRQCMGSAGLAFHKTAWQRAAQSLELPEPRVERIESAPSAWRGAVPSYFLYSRPPPAR